MRICSSFERVNNTTYKHLLQLAHSAFTLTEVLKTFPSLRSCTVTDVLCVTHKTYRISPFVQMCLFTQTQIGPRSNQWSEDAGGGGALVALAGEVSDQLAVADHQKQAATYIHI